MGFSNYFKYLNKAMQFIPVIGLVFEALADKKLEPDEIVTCIDAGLDAIGVKGLDDSDIYVERKDGGGFAVHFSEKAEAKLSVTF